MKRVILLSGILIMFFSASDILAQRRKQENRDRGNRKEDVRKNDRNDRNKDRGREFNKNDRNHRNNSSKDRFGRDVRLVNRRVYKDNRRPVYNTRIVSNRNSRVYYDYDFRSGRRFKVNRGFRPSNRHIWIAGNWNYDRKLRRDVWVGGHWSLRRSFHRWIPGHYQVFNGTRIYIEGCWTIR